MAARSTDVVTTVGRLGGTCTWRELRRAVPWRLIGATVEAGLLVHPGRGIYTLPAADAGRVVAARLTGVVSHRTAALHWGWKVKTAPTADPTSRCPPAASCAPARGASPPPVGARSPRPT